MPSTLCEIRASPDGTLLEIAFIPDSGTGGPGTFSARRRGPGDADFSTPFTPNDPAGNPLRSDGSGFGFDKAREGPDRWVLVMVQDGSTTLSHWYSADSGASWKQFGS